MPPRFASLLLALPVAVTTGALLPQQAASQSKPSKSDADISRIGHRDVGLGVNFYSLEKEAVLGKTLAQEFERSSRLIIDPLLEGYLNQLAQKIAQHSDARLAITVKIFDSDQINAFNLPGGFQYVNSSLLLETETESELAGVLSYGIAHSALRSSSKLATKGEILELTSIPAMIFTPYGWADYCIYQGMNLSIPLTFLKFHRDAVLAADYFGMQYLYASGYDPEGLPGFLERTWPKTASGSKPVPTVFSAFPPVLDRVKAMRKEIQQILPTRDAATVSTSEFEAMHAHLRALLLSNSAASDERKPTLRRVTEKSPSHKPL